MLKNYIKNALRNLQRSPGYSFINIGGLATGMAVCLMIGLFVRSELSYDRFHLGAENIYRVVQEEVEDDGLAWSGPKMGIKLKEDFPQIETILRLIDGGSGYGTTALVSYEDQDRGGVKKFNEDGFLYADPSFFSFSTFPLISGSAKDVLTRPGTVVVSESTARKYFGDENPLGKTLMLNNSFSLEVTGVAADPPKNSHLKFDFVASYRTFYANRGISGELDSFWWPPTHTYLKLREGRSASEINKQLPAFQNRYRDPDDASRMTPRLQPLSEIWLGPNYIGQQQAGGSMVYTYLFSAVAIFILILACMNFVNLATARSGKRAKEIGIRKSAGAARVQLVVQFLAESILLSLAALSLAFLLAELLLPYFNSIASKQITIPYGAGWFWLTISVVTFLTGLAAGIYPALYLSGFRPAVAFQGPMGQPSGGTVLRKGLVIFQFAISMILLVGTSVVYQQLNYVQQARMGFDKKHMVMLPGEGLSEDSRYETFRAELLRYTSVQQVSSTSHRPGQNSGSVYVWEAEGLPNDANRQFSAQFVGEDFFKMLQVEIVAGRPLRANTLADIGTSRPRIDQDIETEILENRAIVINETAAQRLGWTSEEALGKQLRLYVREGDNIYQDFRGRVVGIVEDYHTTTLHEPIQPVAYMPAKSPQGGYFSLNRILVKLAPGNIKQSLQAIEEIWKKIVPERPFDAVFLDESLNDLYRKELRLGKFITAFTLLAIVIACLGLFGLAAYTAETRTKEIGIRKVLGATVSQIIALLSIDFIKLVMTGFAIAVPIAWLLMHQWLQNFAYSVNIGWQVFAWTGIGAMLLALLTISWQSARAALMNPVKTLRSE